ISLYRKHKGNLPSGRLFGLFLTICFSMRFLIEFLKEVQESWEEAYLLDMGQILSIPFILAGIVILILSHKGILEPKDAKKA
ncbi:MAG: prolipoprotein diacylglyceryl transferase, partial [Bacteroidales bacterium]|nr:prolipoprotein diacylglyceryl transferase [Bacteroidales bacterium]